MLLGTVIENYQIIRELGAREMGAVHLGQPTLLWRCAAIEVLPVLTVSPDIVSRLLVVAYWKIPGAKLIENDADTRSPARGHWGVTLWSLLS